MSACDGPFRVRVLAPADPAVIRVVTPGPVGGDGKPGRDGAGGITTVLTADVALGGHRVVRATSTGCDLASSDDVDYAGAVAGITFGAAAPGTDTVIVRSGAMVESSWSQVMQGAQGGDLRWASPTADFAWIDIANVAVPMDAPTLIGLAQAAMNRRAALIFAARAIKDRIATGATLTIGDDALWPT